MNKTSVCILDDEAIVGDRLQPELEDEGYEVETFTDSEAALKRVNEKYFDIVITDLKMEGIDGMEFLERVKKKWPKSEVIVITGYATIETFRESFVKGAFEFIAKPFRLSEIREAVKKAKKKARRVNLVDSLKERLK